MTESFIKGFIDEVRRDPSAMLQSAMYDLRFQHPEKRFGNEKGLALLKERDEYTATMERIQAELASLRASTNATQEENIKIQAEIKDIREKVRKLYFVEYCEKRTAD